MVIKQANPEILECDTIVAKSNGIQYYSNGDYIKSVWPINVKKRINGVYSFCSKHLGKCIYAGKTVYDFTKDGISKRNNHAWIDISPNDVFYDQIKAVYEINMMRKLKQKQKKDELEFARCLNSVDNDFTEQEFMEHLLNHYNIIISFSADHENAKVYVGTTKWEYCVLLNASGRPYYAKKYGKDTKSIRVQFKLGEIKLSGIYTWETMLKIVNMKLSKEITVDELKEIIGIEKVKEAV